MKFPTYAIQRRPEFRESIKGDSDPRALPGFSAKMARGRKTNDFSLEESQSLAGSIERGAKSSSNPFAKIEGLWFLSDGDPNGKSGKPPRASKEKSGHSWPLGMTTLGIQTTEGGELEGRGPSSSEDSLFSFGIRASPSVA